MRSLKVCSHAGCPELVPCPKHARPANAPWSRDRDMKAQYHFRNAVLARDGHRCTRCGTPHRLVAHHLRPGYDVGAGVTLCIACHRAVDTMAR